MSFGAKTSNEAQDSFKEMSREDYSRYLDEYQPIEDEQIASIDSPERLERKLSDATSNTNESFDVAEGTLARNASRYGADMSGDAGALSKRKLDLQRSLAVVDSKNTTRDNVKKRDFAMLARRIATGQKTRANANVMGGAAAGAEVRENERNRSRANAGLGGFLKLAGTAVGFMVGGPLGAAAAAGLTK